MPPQKIAFGSVNPYTVLGYVLAVGTLEEIYRSCELNPCRDVHEGILGINSREFQPCMVTNICFVFLFQCFLLHVLCLLLRLYNILNYTKRKLRLHYNVYVYDIVM